MTDSGIPQHGKDRPSKDVDWYNPDVQSNIRPEMQDLLLNHCKIPAEDLVAHVTEVVCQPIVHDDLHFANNNTSARVAGMYVLIQPLACFYSSISASNARIYLNHVLSFTLRFCTL